MNKLTTFILLVLTLSFNNSFSQHNFKIELGGGYVDNTIPGDLLRHWDKGWLVNLTGSMRLVDKFDFTATLVYQNLKFNASNVGITSPAIVGIRHKIEGTNSQVFQALVGIRAVMSKGFVHPFLSLKGGVLFIDQGKVLITRWMEPTPEDSHIYPYIGSGGDYVKGIASMGLGVMLELITNLNLVVEGNYTLIIIRQSNSLSSLTTSLQYSF